jgi:hypothetical protein
MTVALVATVGVLLWQRWSWLALVAYLCSAPQAGVWVADERSSQLGLAPRGHRGVLAPVRGRCARLRAARPDQHVSRPLRLAGLGLLGLAVAKVFVVDLARLESGWRVGSFLAIGLLLLGAAFAYQRIRHEGQH